MSDEQRWRAGLPYPGRTGVQIYNMGVVFGRVSGEEKRP
jgi:hypothetical protein